MICDWPEGKDRLIIPLTYATETMNGYEYAVAILMIQSGLIEEGVSVVKAIHDRYDGEKRNPLNEFECGSNDARSMASYVLLNAFSRFEFNYEKVFLDKARIGVYIDNKALRGNHSPAPPSGSQPKRLGCP